MLDSEALNTAADWPADPMSLFEAWYRQAAADGVTQPDTMALATTTRDALPSVRYVFLRGVDEGFCFYTNYNSRKGQELIENPHAAVVFYWHESYRQVRIEGRVEKVTPEQSDSYFYSRERSKRLSAAVSQQSDSITDWRELRAAADSLGESDDPVARPEHWGGFRILPARFEFWIGSSDRMHRRCAYSVGPDGSWTRELLAP